MLDAGCGEGVLVSEYADRLAIEGVDAHYSSERVHAGSVTALPYGPGVFDRALCLDVLEHLTFEEQPVALAELHRVLRPGGELLVSVPNLAHLQSRVHFLLQGRLIRTASELKHPGDRPVAEYHPARASGPDFVLVARTRDLSDRPGADPLDPPAPARAPAAAPVAHPPHSRARLVLPEPADVPETTTDNSGTLATTTPTTPGIPRPRTTPTTPTTRETHSAYRPL